LLEHSGRVSILSPAVTHSINISNKYRLAYTIIIIWW